ncbi:hypothetical protein [Nostoc sp. PA-18-2419]|uniref:hypothetical protein n=1 Tax=Nostoc sp. PA-18-2419 TaxID=2575443 RepID=UPI001107BA50|nr:hypothetical protein [Nostoc sp. PA-18-2419]
MLNSHGCTETNCASCVSLADFTNFEQINLNQAWSLFFTAGQDDKALGKEIELRKFFTNLLIVVGVTGILWGTFFSNLE